MCIIRLTFQLTIVREEGFHKSIYAVHIHGNMLVSHWGLGFDSPHSLCMESVCSAIVWVSQTGV